MAKLLKSPVRRRVRRWLGTLFREARRLERRRRLRYAGGVAPACGIATGGGFLIANHGEPSPGRGYPANADESADLGESPPTHAGNSTIGIYYVTSAAYESSVNEPQQIVRLSPNTAAQRTFASVPAPPDGDSYGEGPPSVALGRSFYFLDPPLLDYPGENRPPIVEGRAVLYRATPNDKRRDRVTARGG